MVIFTLFCFRTGWYLNTPLLFGSYTWVRELLTRKVAAVLPTECRLQSTDLTLVALLRQRVWQNLVPIQVVALCSLLQWCHSLQDPRLSSNMIWSADLRQFKWLNLIELLVLHQPVAECAQVRQCHHHQFSKFWLCNHPVLFSSHLAWSFFNVSLPILGDCICLPNVWFNH